MEKQLKSRRTDNQVQELKSLGQIVECLADWLPNRLSEDVGEDLIVQIEENGVWTGLSFWVQAKSTTDLMSLRLKTRPYFSYSIEVNDLLRWEVASPPVVIVVWDTEKRIGAWIDVVAAIERLDGMGREWRGRQEKVVYLPVENRLDEESGRSTLRHRIADLAITGPAKGKTVKIESKFEFANDPEGQVLFQRVRDAFDKGDQVTVPASSIKEWKISPWWERLHGSHGGIREITIGPSKSSTEIRTEFLAIGKERSETIGISLPQLKAGRREATFSNEDRKAEPLRMTVVVPLTPRGEERDPEARLHVTMSAAFPVESLQKSIEMARFLLAAHEAGEFHIRLVDTGGILATVNVDSLAGMPSFEELLAWERLLHKLRFIETKTSRYGWFDLSTEILRKRSEGIGKYQSDNDLLTVDRLYAMCQGDPWETEVTLSMILGDGAEEIQEEGELAIEVDPFDTWRLLGVSIPIEKVRMTVVDSDKFAEAYNAAMISASRALTVTCRVRYVLLAWGDVAPRNQRHSAGA